MSHFIRELSLLTGLQGTDEVIYPAGPALEAVEELPECILVSLA